MKCSFASKIQIVDNQILNEKYLFPCAQQDFRLSSEWNQDNLLFMDVGNENAV